MVKRNGAPPILRVHRSAHWCWLGDLVPPVRNRLPAVEARVGIHDEAVDITDPQSARWLRACAFAEQIERRFRLDAALELDRAILASRRPEVVGADAAEVLPAVRPRLWAWLGSAPASPPDEP